MIHKIQLSLFDECHYGAPFTSVHADSIDVCAETCDVSIFVLLNIIRKVFFLVFVIDTNQFKLQLVSFTKKEKFY